MNTFTTPLSVTDALARVRQLLIAKDFVIFADIDHSANAEKVELELSEARTLIFGNPLAGTKLMQKDIRASLNLPLRIAIVDAAGETQVLYPSTEDFTRDFDLDGHPVLEKIAALFAAIEQELKG